MAKILCGFLWSLREIEIGRLDESLPLFLSDVDECHDGSHDCHSDATCKNTVGYFTCNCTDGYSGDGRNCEVSDQLKLECSCQTPKGVLILSDTLFTKL